MKTYKNSTLSYKCKECGLTIYNADRNYRTCENCGYELIKVDRIVKDLECECGCRRRCK